MGADETRYLRLEICGTTHMSGRRLLLGNIAVNVVPEPATMGLLAFGGLGVLIRRRNG